MRISLLVPCFNEEKTLRRSIQSWLSQSRPFDEVVVVDDSSTDATPEILKEFEHAIIVARTPQNSGNKSYAQEFGLQFITGDIFIATDGDTFLNERFVEHIEKNFSDPKTVAVNGYVKSIKYNWLTACRALEYSITQNFDKIAQKHLNYLFVIPGVAGAFRTHVFKRDVTFDHDTVTEDLDFTYKLHELGHRIVYDRKAICYTQDPATLKSYINQLRRWYGGGWQNLLKHLRIPQKPGMAFELSLVYGERIIFSCLVVLLPLVNVAATGLFFMMSLVYAAICAFFGMLIEKRPDFLFIIPLYAALAFVNSYVFLEQFVMQVLFEEKNLVWFKPERVSMQ